MRLNYDPAVDLDTLCVAALVPLVLAIHADRPERTLAELIASARRESTNCAVPGTRTPMTLAALTMNRELGTQLNPVPYQGGSAVARDLAGGQVPLGMAGPLSVQAMVKAGRVRVLAVLQRERARLLPELAKILDCGAAAVEQRAAPDCMLGTLDGDDFIVEPLRPDYRCTPQSVASHAMYETADPHVLIEPSGTLRLDLARYEALSDHAVRVRGSRFEPAARYTNKIEGVRLAGYSSVVFGGVRDPFILAELDRWYPRSGSTPASAKTAPPCRLPPWCR